MPSDALPARGGAVTEFWGRPSTTSIRYAVRWSVYLVDDQCLYFWFMSDLLLLPGVWTLFDLSLLPFRFVLSTRCTCQVFLRTCTCAASVIIILDHDRYGLPLWERGIHLLYRFFSGLTPSFVNTPSIDPWDILTQAVCLTVATLLVAIDSTLRSKFCGTRDGMTVSSTLFRHRKFNADFVQEKLSSAWTSLPLCRCFIRAWRLNHNYICFQGSVNKTPKVQYAKNASFRYCYHHDR